MDRIQYSELAEFIFFKGLTEPHLLEIATYKRGKRWPDVLEAIENAKTGPRRSLENRIAKSLSKVVNMKRRPEEPGVD